MYDNYLKFRQSIETNIAFFSSSLFVAAKLTNDGDLAVTILLAANLQGIIVQAIDSKIGCTRGDSVWCNYFAQLHSLHVW